MAGLYDDTPGLSDGTGLWRGRLGLFSGASGFINGGGGAAYIDLYFSAGTYSVSGSNYTTLGSIPGFTFTRASLAMGYDATGKLTYGPNNLCLQSQTFDNASWVGTNRTVTANTSVAPDGSTTADTVAGTGAGGTLLRQDVAVPGVATVLVSFYVKADTATTCMIYDVNIGPQGVFNLSTGAVISGSGASIFSAGNGWYRCVVSYSPVGGFARVTINPGSTFNPTTTSAILVWGAQYEAVTYQTTPSTYYPTTTAAYYGPRLVYDPVTLASQGILVEEARTNLCLQSSTFNTTWSAVAASVTVNSTTAPDGTTTADTLVPTAVSNQHRLDQTTTITAAAHNASVYAKAAGYGFLWMRLGSLGGIFNLTTGAITSLSGGTTGVATDVGNGWWRCSLQGTTAGSDVYRLAVTPTASTADYTGDGTSGIYLWGAQLEAGTGASSPIPTTTASVTRAADDAVLTGLSLPGPCSFATDALAPAFVSTDARHTLSDGNTNNRLWLSYNGSILNVNAMVANTGVSPVSSPTVAPGVAFKAAQSSNNGTYLSVVNGGTVETASGGVMPTLTRLDIGKNAASSLRYWNNAISRIRIFNRALSDAQLQSLTS